jgi:hypothetical protein
LSGSRLMLRAASLEVSRKFGFAFSIAGRLRCRLTSTVNKCDVDFNKPSRFDPESSCRPRGKDAQ